MAVTVGSLLDDEHWHSVHIERFNKQVNLTVDSHTRHFQTRGEGHSLEVDYEVSLLDAASQTWCESSNFITASTERTQPAPSMSALGRHRGFKLF